MVKGSVSLPTELLHCYGIQRCFGCYCLFSFRTPVVVISSVVSCLGCFFWLHQSHGGLIKDNILLYIVRVFSMQMVGKWGFQKPWLWAFSRINLDKNKIPKDPKHVSIHPIFSWNEHGISWTRHAILDFPEVISIQGTGVPSRSGNDIPTFVEHILGLFRGPDNLSAPITWEAVQRRDKRSSGFFPCVSCDGHVSSIPTPLFWENGHVNLLEKCRLFQWKLFVDKKGS